MATIDSSLVRRELRAIESASKIISNRLEKLFEQLEKDPSVYPQLEEIDARIYAEFTNLVLRKAYLTHGKHDFRVVFAHWSFADSEHVDFLLAFRRKKGYQIDWDWLADQLRD